MLQLPHTYEFPKFIFVILFISFIHFTTVGEHINTYMISIILNLLRLVWWTGIRSILGNVHAHLRRKGILLALGGVFYRYLLGIWFIVVQVFYILVDFLPAWSIHHRRWILKSPSTLVELSVYTFNSISFCCVHFGALFVGACIFIIVIIYCPSLLIIFVLKSVWSDY